MGHNKTRKGRVARLIRMGKKLKRLRENFNLTQQQVAEALGIDRSTYAYYELGRTTPDLDKIDKLQRLYQVQYQDLIEYDEEENRMQLRDSGSDLSLIHIFQAAPCQKPVRTHTAKIFSKWRYFPTRFPPKGIYT